MAQVALMALVNLGDRKVPECSVDVEVEVAVLEAVANSWLTLWHPLL